MKIIRKVSIDEMKQHAPDLMAALDSPTESWYCIQCDGLRLFDFSEDKKKGTCRSCCTERDIHQDTGELAKTEIPAEHYQIPTDGPESV